MNVKGLTPTEIHTSYFKEQKSLEQVQMRMGHFGGGVIQTTKDEKPKSEEAPKKKKNDLLKNIVKKGKICEDDEEINHFSDDYDEE